MINTEKQALATAIIYPETGPILFANLDENSFLGIGNQKIFKTIKDLWETGNSFDRYILLDLLPDQSEFLTSLSGYVEGVSAKAARYFIVERIKVIKESRVKKALLSQISEEAASPHPDLERIIEVAESGKLLESSREDGDFQAAVDEYMEWKALEKTKIDLGFHAFDYRTGSYHYGELLAIMGRTTAGKCHARGTGIIMYDGSIKKIELIKPGDEVMGIDSKPRKVLRIGKGKGQMYKISPVYGESFRVNEDHILSLRRTDKHSKGGYFLWDRIVNISVKEYLKQTPKFKHIHKLFRVPIDFPEKEVPIEPYFLGIWLGDGNSHEAAITTQDREIVEYLKEYAKKTGLKLKKSLSGNGVALYRISSEKGGRLDRYSLTGELRKIKVLKNKHIPFEYKTNCRKNRLELLAGLIDTDGCVSKHGYEFDNTNERLINDVIYLCRSLGFSAIKGQRIVNTNFASNYKTYRIFIGGNVDRIPVKIVRKKQRSSGIKNVLNKGFSIEKDGYDEFFGFQLNGDNLYLTADFFTHHNSFVGLNIIDHLIGACEDRIGLFSLEMTKAAIVERMMQLFFNIYWRELDEKREAKELYLEDFIKRYREKLRIYSKVYSVFEIADIIKRDRLKIVFIDYLQLLKKGREGRSRYEKVTYLTEEIKEIAKNQDVFIVMMVQISREGEGGWEPVAIDMARESGAIEENSDFIIGCWQPSLKEGAEEYWQDKLCMKLLKNKRGPTIGCEFSFNKDSRRIFEICEGISKNGKERKSGKPSWAKD